MELFCIRETVSCLWCLTVKALETATCTVNMQHVLKDTSVVYLGSWLVHAPSVLTCTVCCIWCLIHKPMSFYWHITVEKSSRVLCTYMPSVLISILGSKILFLINKYFFKRNNILMKQIICQLVRTVFAECLFFFYWYRKIKIV